MKRIATLSLLAALTASGAAFAQSGDMKGMDMQACKDMMKDMDSGGKAQGRSKSAAVHKTAGVVKAVDRVNGIVTLAHGPVPGLKWPAMTMGFTVKDRTLFDRLTLGQKVDVEFMKQGSDYVVTAVK